MNSSRPELSSRWDRAIAPVVALMPALVAGACMLGCGGNLDPASASPEPPETATQGVEVSIGAFRVPLATRERDLEENDPLERNCLLLRFQLHVLVPPEHEKNVARRIETHAARLHEEVRRVCRSASLDELSEPGMSALKGQLAAVLTKYFATRESLTVVLTDIRLEPT